MQDAAPAEVTFANEVTRRLASFAANLTAEHLGNDARTWATHAVLDWSGVTLAARDEPVVRLLTADAASVDGQGMACTLVGQNQAASLYDAVLINGAAGHALDYDDVIRAMGGHPSVPTIPVALALAEERGITGLQTITAIAGGFEVACALGVMTGTSHYEKGFHNTATLGTFGAAATAGIMLALSEEQMQTVLGLAASMASGLKCNFGTMTKPFHAGTAAQAGLRAARLAAAGFTANRTAIETEQGFAATQVPVFDPGAWSPPNDRGGFAIEKTLFKYHAACYGTHGVLEAIGKLRRDHGVGLSDLKYMTLFVNTRSAGNCNQADPKTGLALKFSIRLLAIAALAGENTAALDTYCEAVATNPDYVAVRERVSCVFEPERDRMTAMVTLETIDGRTISADADVGRPASELSAQWSKLSQKFIALTEPVIGTENTEALLAEIASLETINDTTRLMQLLSGAQSRQN